MTDQPIVLSLADYSSRWYRDRAVSGHGPGRGVTLEAKEGDWVGVVGDNGTGKSTFAAGLCGLAPFSSGVLQLGHRKLRPRSKYDRFRESVTYVGQQASFPQNISFDALRRIFFTTRIGIANESCIGELTDRFVADLGLASRNALDELPTRLKEYLLSVASAPTVLVMDEVGPAFASFASRQSPMHVSRSFEPYAWARKHVPRAIVFVIDHNRQTVINACDRLIYFGDPSRDTNEQFTRPVVLDIASDRKRAEEIAARSESVIEDYIGAHRQRFSLPDDGGVSSTLSNALAASSVPLWRRSRERTHLLRDFPFLVDERQTSFIGEEKRVAELSGGQRVVLTAIVDRLVNEAMPPEAVLGHLAALTREKLLARLKALSADGKAR